MYSVIYEDEARFRRGYRKTITTVGLIAFPVLLAAGLTGRELVLILFGNQWEPAIVPFQILCAAGTMKMVNIYNSAAVQGVGKVWGEVWCQLLYIALMVALVVVGARWGLPGAAVGVFVATATMAMLMQVLLSRVTVLGWSDMWSPLLPGLVCAAGVLVLVGGARLGLLARGVSNVWVVAAVQGGVALLWGLAFLRWTRFAAVRELVAETIAEFGPRLKKRFSS